MTLYHINKERFLSQVCKSEGSVYLHLQDGEMIDLKRGGIAVTMFRSMDIPFGGIEISTEIPGDMMGFFRLLMESDDRVQASLLNVNLKNDRADSINEKEFLSNTEAGVVFGIA